MFSNEVTQTVGWAVWITGLPGSGKSTLANALARLLAENGLEVEILRMDERRKKYFPIPAYTPEERDKAYVLFVREAAELVMAGRNVIMDASGHKLAYRQYAANLIPRFAEVYAACPLETAMHREASRPEGAVMAGLYAKALQRKHTGGQFPGLGMVIGVDEPFEVNPEAACTVDMKNTTSEAAAAQVLICLQKFL